MYPNQTPPPPHPETNPGDYLDSIASPVRQQTMKPWLLWAIIGGGLLILVIFVMTLFSGGSNEADDLTDVVQRAQALEQLTKSEQKNIQSSDLRTINSSLTLLLANVEQTSSDPAAKLGLKKIPKVSKKSPVTAEFTQLSDKLEDARLNAIFDRIYAREIAYQVDKLLALMKRLEKRSDSKSIKAFVETNAASLQPVGEQFTNFNEEA